MSEDYYPVCVDCMVRYPRYFASASAFYAMHTPFRDHADLKAFEEWLGAHERHDIRIVWEQSELAEEIWDKEYPEPTDAADPKGGEHG